MLLVIIQAGRKLGQLRQAVGFVDRQDLGQQWLIMQGFGAYARAPWKGDWVL